MASRAERSGGRGEQLRMFMTAREIMATHQPGEGDRQPVDAMNDDAWVEASQQNVEGSSGRFERTSTGMRVPWFRSYGPGQDKDWEMPKGPIMVPRELESHEAVWNRKAAQMTSGESDYYTELGQSIAKEGVHEPVTLSHQFGMTGKPQVIQGMHRVVGQMAADPDRYIPVEHAESWASYDAAETAKQEAKWKKYEEGRKSGPPL